MSKPTAFRLDDETDRLLDALAARHAASRVDVLRLAIRRLARVERIAVKDAADADTASPTIELQPRRKRSMSFT